MFQMCWTQHGGSGLHWTRSEVLELEVNELKWFLDRISEERNREARAIERAMKKR